MRLRPERVENLAKKVMAALREHQRVEFVASQEQVELAIRGVILTDLRREDDLEKEAEEILRQYRQKIDMNNMSYNTLVTKTKAELAKKRRIIL